MKKIIYILGLVTVYSFNSCESSLEDTINEINATDPEREGSKTEYTISDEDYEAIVPSNDLDFYHEEKAFISEDDAAEKIPVILLDRFGGELKDEFVVNYNVINEEFLEIAVIIDSLNNISSNFLEGSYTFIDEDYGNGESAFLFDVDELTIDEKLIEVVQNQFSDIQDGDRFNVTYSQFLEELSAQDTSNTTTSDDSSFIFDNDTTNGWEIIDVFGDLPSDVWVPSDNFNNIQASGFSSGSANPNEDWLVSPAIDLGNFNNPVALIEQQIDFATGDELALLEIKISVDYTGDVETTEWDNLDFENAPEGGDGDYLISEPLSLLNYADREVNIAFRYKSTEDVSPRWRIRRFEVIEGDEFKELNKSFIFNDEEFVEIFAYRLVAEDYNEMGESNNQPGRFDNFSNSVPVSNYIPQLLEGFEELQFAQIDDIVFVGYDFFSGETSSLFPAWINSEDGWIEYNDDNFLGDDQIKVQSIFVYVNEVVTDSGEVVFNTYVLKTATPYIMMDDDDINDYDLVVDALEGVEGFENQVDNLGFFGNFNRNGGDTNWSDEQLEQALAIVLEERFPDAKEGDQFEITYDFFRGGSSSESIIFEFTEDGEFNSPSLSE